MPQVETTVTIDAPLDVVWEMAQDVEKLPEIVPDLDAVHILEREQLTPTTTRVVSEWHGRIKKFNRPMVWTEEDIWNAEDHTCRFWQTKGDFTEYGGQWRFKEQDGGTHAHLKIEYKFDVPLLGALIQKVVQNLLQENSDDIMNALRAEAERRMKER
jgi:ribosome-associated toxin RatA of RatAB toxin-antitoxin module